jgi:FixJ family two-component response regulator
MNAIPGESGEFTIHIIEDDDSSRVATPRFMRAAGCAVRSYGSAGGFFASPPREGAGCVVLDLDLPGPSGLDVQQALADVDEPLPVLTGSASVAQSVRAMKARAIDFLTKADDGSALLDAVARARERAARAP